MKTFRTIVSGFDFTPNSESALKEALRIAGEEHGSVVACHVISPRYIDDQQTFLNLPTDLILKKVEEAVVQRLAELAQGAAVQPSAKVIIGRPEFALAGEAASAGAQLLVLGASSDDARKTGVIARRCLQEATCPVLISRDHHAGPYRSIVAAVDLSELSQHVVEAATMLAVDEQAPIRVLHAHYPPWMHPTNVLYDLRPAQDEDYREQYHELLEDRMAELIRSSAQFLPVQPIAQVVENMSEVDAILRVAADSDADLLAFGCHGRSGLKERVLGTNAERLLLRSHCSVLAVPAPQSPQA